MNIKFILTLFFLFTFFTLDINAQSSSIYSRYGLGDLDYSYSVRRMGMGQLGTSIADVDFISIINPASLYRISKTRIEFSINHSGTFLANNSEKNYFAETEFGGFTMGVPISSQYGIGAALGLVPATNVSYNIFEQNTSGKDYTTEYSGTGGLSKFFVSTSYKLPFEAIVGASFDYYFGNISYLSRIDFLNSSSLSSEFERSYQYRGVSGTLGVISPDMSQLFNTASISDFRIGISYNLSSKLKTDTSYTVISLFNLDTLKSGRTEAEIPGKISLGASLLVKNKYLLSFDYSAQAWSNFLSNNSSIPELRDAYKISSGFEYRPLRELGSTFWEQILFRAGLSYEQTQYFINGKGINQYSLSLGASLPMGSENTLDFALMYSRRGTKEANLLQEDIIKFGVGFSLGELWFLRQDK